MSRFQSLPCLAHQRIRWLGALLVLGTLAWLFTHYPHPQDHQPSPAYFGPHQALLQDGLHGFLPLPSAQNFCQHRRWLPYSTRDRPRKIYDLFLINTELDFLSLRLHELADQVDYFLVLESPTTFQMTPKHLYLQSNFSAFSAFHHKIIHRVLSPPTAANKVPKDDSWELERFTRNALFDQILLSLTGEQAPNQGDVLLVGDIDEIPRRSTLTALRNCAFPPRVTLRSQMYYYSFQWLHRGELWHHPQATFFNGVVKTVRPEDLRTGKPDAEVWMGGWHCSSCFGTMGELKNKIVSFSHRSYNQPYFLESERLLRSVRRGEDLFERAGEFYDRVDGNLDVPEYLRGEGREKFGYMLDRDAEDGGFADL